MFQKELREPKTKVTNPDGGNTEVLGIGEFENLANNTQGKLIRRFLKKALFVPGYCNSFVLVSSIVDSGHKIVHKEGESLLCLKNKSKIPIEKNSSVCDLLLNMVSMVQIQVGTRSIKTIEQPLWPSQF